MENKPITWRDVFRNDKPDITDEEIDFILWERTAYPLAPSEHVMKQIESIYKMEETNNDEVINLLCKKVTRLEVIDSSDKGRQLVKYLASTEKLEFQLQDDNRTLKIFIINH